MMIESLLIRVAHPDEVLYGGTRKLFLVSTGDVSIYMNDIEIVQKLRDVVTDILLRLSEIATNPHNGRAVRELVSRTPKRTLADIAFKMLGGKRRRMSERPVTAETICRIEIILDGLDSVKRGNDSEFIDLTTSTGLACSLQIVNIVTARHLLDILKAMVRDHASDPYGPGSQYAELMQAKVKQLKLFFERLRTVIGAQTRFGDICQYSDTSFVRAVKSLAADPDPVIRAEVRRAVMQVLPFEAAPSWATEIANGE